MWIFSSIGFFSAVAGKTNDGKIDPFKIVVRARLKDHLITLVKKYTILNGTEITQSVSTDYRFRIVVDKATWIEVMMSLTEDVDYSNFKNSVPHDSTGYHQACVNVWGVMNSLQYRGDPKPIYTKTDKGSRFDRYLDETRGDLYDTVADESQYGGYSSEVKKLFNVVPHVEEPVQQWTPVVKKTKAERKKERKEKSKRRGWFFGDGKTEQDEQERIVE